MDPLNLSLFLVVSLSLILGGVSQGPGAKEFFQKLESNSYDKYTLPEGSKGPGSPVRVEISAYILDVYKDSDSDSDFNAQFYFRQTWNDSRLKNDLGHDLIINTVDNIWTPDSFFIEERRGLLHDIVQSNIFCRIKPNGEVLFSVRISLKFGCHLDLRSFPHDIQKCHISIESYGFTKDRVDLQWHGHGRSLGFEKNLKMLDFDVIEVTETTQGETLTTGDYTRLQINMTLKRKFGHFATGLYVPFVILVIIAILSLWIKAEERILRLTLLLVVLSMMISISVSVNFSAPHAPYTKASDVWIGFCESLVFALVLEFIFVALISGAEFEKAPGDVHMNLELEAKENKLQSTLCRVLNMLDARQGGVRSSSALHIDRICRVLTPIIFTLFNIIYWSVY